MSLSIVITILDLLPELSAEDQIGTEVVIAIGGGVDIEVADAINISTSALSENVDAITALNETSTSILSAINDSNNALSENVDAITALNETSTSILSAINDSNNALSENVDTITALNETSTSILSAINDSNNALSDNVDAITALSTSLANELITGKQKVVDAIVYKGGEADISSTYDTLSTQIRALVPANVTIIPESCYPDNWHDLYAVIGDNYDQDYPYCYALLLDVSTPQALLDEILDGDVQLFGGEADGLDTRWALVQSSSQLEFTANYNASFQNYLLGVSVYNADIRNVSFYGSRIMFLHYNENYTVSELQFGLSQFQNNKLSNFIIPRGASFIFDQNSAFQGCSILALFSLPSTATVFEVSGQNTWRDCSALIFFTLPASLTSISISGGYAWYGCAALRAFTLPSSLLSLSLSGSYTWYGCTGLTSFVIPNSLTSLSLQGVGLWYGCTGLISFALPNSIASLSISGGYTWYGCTGLTSFVIPSSITSLTISGGYTWYGCTGLTSFTFSNSLTSLTISDSYVWYGCTGLTSFVFPDSLTSLTISSSSAFFNCTALAYLYMPMASLSFSMNNTTVLGCTALVRIELGSAWDWSIDLRNALYLTTSNIETYILNKLKNNVGLPSKTLTLASKYNALLSVEQKAIATNKNWVLSFV